MPDHDPIASSQPKNDSAESGEIRAPEGVFRSVVLPIILLAFLFLAVLHGTPHLAACDNYFVIKLVYPFFFGALGLILGGSIVVDGHIPLFGEKSKLRAAGGIAGAIVGFGIAQFAQPSDCEPRHSLILKGFPASGSISVTNSGVQKRRDYVGLYDTTSTSVSTAVERTNEATIRDLKFKFGANDASRDGFKVVLRFYRSDLDGTGKLEPAWGCTIEVEVRDPPSVGVKRYRLVPSETLRYEIEFNPNFFNEVEEALKKGATGQDVMCLKGRSRLNGDGPLLETRVEVPFYVARLKGYFGQELWYVVETKNQLTETAAARPPASSTGEISLGSQAQSSGGDISVPKPAQLPNEAPKPARQVIGCSASESQRMQIDRFIGGDDLDSSQRHEIYTQWPDLHCYIWPVVKNGSVAADRSRALKLTVNAIINNSMETNLQYWQPAGPNKRDFSKPLPLLAESDYRLIFDLIKSDDLAVRTEATRFVRNLPVDRFAALFDEQADKQHMLSSSQRERLAIAASFFSYSRIVEWLDPSPEDSAKVTSNLATEFKAARSWTNKIALGESAKAYEAMLWYAKAIVERERTKNDENSRTSFRQVLDAIASTSEPYPSNPLHVAQAAAIAFSVSDPTPALRDIRTAESYTSSTPFNLTTESIVGPTLFAGPAEVYKRAVPKSFTAKDGSRMLLRKGDWVFVQNRDQIGWLRLKAGT